MAVQTVKCPTCQREIDWSQSPFRPFCSERCKLIDL
ncbi:MAG: DNA gyrase inhibitor YacG, partial [Steroidobacteraceae bacterium]